MAATPESSRTVLVGALDGWKAGMTREELSEVITHLAFYAGWPNAMTALGIAKKAFEEVQSEDSGKENT